MYCLSKMITQQPSRGYLFDSIKKLNARNDFAQFFKASSSSPLFLRALPKLEHHVQHVVTRQTSLVIGSGLRQCLN